MESRLEPASVTGILTLDMLHRLEPNDKLFWPASQTGDRSLSKEESKTVSGVILSRQSLIIPAIRVLDSSLGRDGHDFTRLHLLCLRSAMMITATSKDVNSQTFFFFSHVDKRS